jgi:hypothetical protein
MTDCKNRYNESDLPSLVHKLAYAILWILVSKAVAKLSWPRQHF